MLHRLQQKSGLSGGRGVAPASRDLDLRARPVFCVLCNNCGQLVLLFTPSAFLFMPAVYQELWRSRSRACALGRRSGQHRRLAMFIVRYDVVQPQVWSSIRT